MTRAVFVVDTNVVISGFIGTDPSSPPARILDATLAGHLLYLLSGDLFAEYAAVLARPRIVRQHRRTEAELERFLTVLAANGMWRNPEGGPPAPDSDDAHIWALLADWQGSRLITGDQRLLDSPPRPGAALTPRTAIESVRPL